MNVLFVHKYSNVKTFDENHEIEYHVCVFVFRGFTTKETFFLLSFSVSLIPVENIPGDHDFIPVSRLFVHHFHL